MGSVSAKPSTPLTHNLVPPSDPPDPAAPTKASPKLRACPAIPKVSHAEWDECMRQSVLTLGTTTMTAIAIGLMIPAADTLLLLGTGAGVLWSVKRCRTIMRDGILSPEETKALEHRKRAEREEKRRQRKMEKEAKQKAAAERNLQKKQKSAATKKSDSIDCCTKVKKALEQKGVNVDNLPCEKLSHETEENKFNAVNTIATRSPSAGDLVAQSEALQGKISDTGDINRVSYTQTQGELAKIKKPVQDMKNSSRSGATKQAISRREQRVRDLHSTVKLFAPYSRNMSESVILTCGNKDCTCYSNEANCTCDSSHPVDEEPQTYTLARDPENEDLPDEEDPDNLIVRPINSALGREVEREDNVEIHIMVESTNAQDSVSGENGLVDHPIAGQGFEEDGHDVGVEGIMSPELEREEPLNDNSLEVVFEDTEDVDIKIAEIQDGFDIEVIKHEMADDRIDEPKNELDVVYAETHKSESWPFSFSLPSIDKFSKKKNNSFKWPPLTSSIIVKPKKEPTRKSSDELEAKQSWNEKKKKCLCGSSGNDCTCP